MSGETVCDDGTRIATGVFTVGCEHSSAFDVHGVQDHLAHAGLGWADARIIDGVHGPWACGSLKPSVTEPQLRLLRSLTLSGEWVGELAGVLAVNRGGLPVQRSLAASALPGRTVASGVLRASTRAGMTKLVGGNLVGRCLECEKRARAGAAAGGRTGGSRELATVLRRLDESLALGRELEQRTRHLIPAEAAARAGELRAAMPPRS